MTLNRLTPLALRRFSSQTCRTLTPSILHPYSNLKSVHNTRHLTTVPRLSQKPRPIRKHTQQKSARERDMEVTFAPSISSKQQPVSKSKGSSTRRRRPRKQDIRQLVLPEIGLNANQLAALSTVSSKTILKCAKELSETSCDQDTLLSPTIIQLITEELNLPIQFSPQLTPLSNQKVPTDADLSRRMPVVTVMGHVDHGKTSLLDGLRESNLAEKEIGGITQSVAAFRVLIDGDDKTKQRFATFIDTPGHAAFRDMRANGALATDLVVLVVAADDGVMPQTIEATKLARAANVPIIVAINKCDIPNADPDRVRYELLEKLDLNTEQLGGDVQCIEISAKTKQNLPELLEAIIAEAEVLDLRTDSTANASGVCMESRIDKAMGSVATVVIKNGTLKVGDIVAFQSPKAIRGELFGKVRSMLTSDNQRVNQAGPGIAVGLAGLKEPVPPGAEICVLPSEKLARAKSSDIIAKNMEAISTIELANRIIEEQRQNELQYEAESKDNSAGENDKGGSHIEDTKIPGSLVVLIKGDVKGSSDAIAQCIRGLHTPEVPIKVVGANVGEVNDFDIQLVSATNKNKNRHDKTMIIAFNLRVKDSVLKYAHKMGVEVLNHSLIYHLEDEVKETLEKIKLEESGTEEVVGKAQVLRVFEDGKIAGCSIADGIITEGDSAKIMRLPEEMDAGIVREEIFEGQIETIKHFAKTVRSVNKGTECGIAVAGWEDFRQGDQIECVVVRKVK